MYLQFKNNVSDEVFVRAVIGWERGWCDNRMEAVTAFPLMVTKARAVAALILMMMKMKMMMMLMMIDDEWR